MSLKKLTMRKYTITMAIAPVSAATSVLLLLLSSLLTYPLVHTCNCVRSDRQNQRKPEPSIIIPVVSKASVIRVVH